MTAWREIPLLLQPNMIVETGRASYRKVVQLLPRTGGIRECICARKGHVFCSCDYEAGELITHAQSCIWIAGQSKLADALLAGVKPHNAFAATVLGIGYDEFQKRFKAGDKQCKDVRQAAKPANFGFPGGMGAPKLVLQQRKQGPDTPCPGGPHMILDEDENLVEGYRGLRFCILMDGTTSCGKQKLTEFKGKPISPTCADCIDCCVRLRSSWFRQWPENEVYFDFVSGATENGQVVDDDDRRLLCVNKLQPGQIMQHISRRIRGNVNFTSGANGYFQALLAEAAKRALCEAQRECYCVPDSPLYSSRIIVFEHDEDIAEVPTPNLHAAGWRLSAIMVKWLQTYCPDLAPAVRAEPAGMPRWYKGAIPWWLHGKLKSDGTRDKKERATDLEDTLIPWEPKKKKEAA